MPNDYRIVWLYLVDSCSTAGLWKKDIRGLNFNCNTSITEDELLKFTGDRLVDCGKYFFIPAFLKFQNPAGISSDKPVVKGIRKQIAENCLFEIIKQRLGNDYSIIGLPLGNGTRKGNRKIIRNRKGNGKGTGMEREQEKEALIFPFETETFKAAWAGWNEYRNVEKGLRWKSPKSEQTALNKLGREAGDEQRAIAMIEQSIANQYQGLFELKQNRNNNGKKELTRDEKFALAKKGIDFRTVGG